MSQLIPGKLYRIEPNVYLYKTAKCCAEEIVGSVKRHGLALYVETTRDRQAHKVVVGECVGWVASSQLFFFYEVA